MMGERGLAFDLSLAIAFSLLISATVHIRQRPHGIKNLDNQIYGLIIIFMASRHVFECEIEYLVVKSCHIWFK